MYLIFSRVIPLAVLAVLVGMNSTAASAPVINGTLVPSTQESATASASVSATCVLCEVVDLDNVVNPLILQAAQVQIPVGVLGSASVRVHLAETAPAGAAAGFVVRDATGLLDLSVASNITVRTFLDGAVQDERVGSTALRVSPLSADRFAFAMRTTQAFDALEVEVGGALAVLTAVDVLYAAVRVPEPPTILFHTVDDGASVASETSPTCVLCTVSDADQAVDTSFRSAATVEIPLGVLGSADVRVAFGRSVPSNSRTGFLVRRPAGLPGVALLDQLTLSSLAGGEVVEDATGSDLLMVDYQDGRSVVWVRTSEPHDSATLTVAGAAMLAVDLEVFGVLTVMPRGSAKTSADDDLGIVLGTDLDLFDAHDDGLGAAPEQTVALGAPVPNPAFGRTAVRLAASESTVTVALFDALGRRVATLHDGPVVRGGTRLDIDTAGLPAGVYVVSAVSPTGRATQRLTVAR